MPAAAAWSLERYRPLLRLQARQLQLMPRFERRFDSSDLVQETLLRAHRERGQFRGQGEAELLAWLHEILLHVAADEVRKATAQKRDVALEQSLEALAADSSARWEKYLADGDRRRWRRPSGTSSYCVCRRPSSDCRTISATPSSCAT